MDLVLPWGGKNGYPYDVAERLSAVLGHVSWHWMMDGVHELGHQLEHAAATGLPSAVFVVALWLLPALLVGAAAFFLPGRFGGPPVPSLLSRLAR